MKIVVVCLVGRMARCMRKLKARDAACLATSLAMGFALAGCAGDPEPVVMGQPTTLAPLNEYCAVAQKEVASSRVPARNVLMNDYQTFTRATPSINPLETMQFVGYADPQRLKARMISCKLHSPERIRAEYGATAAGEASSCARINRRTLDAVMASLTDRQKKKMPFQGTIGVMLEPDLVARSENEWLEAFTMVEADAGGTLRIRAKSLRPGAPMPVRNKSTAPAGQYCHLIAPDYLKRILTGEVQLPRAEFPERARSASR
jgi:hypothetical protein